MILIPVFSQLPMLGMKKKKKKKTITSALTRNGLGISTFDGNPYPVRSDRVLPKHAQESRKIGMTGMTGPKRECNHGLEMYRSPIEDRN
jgi:hypothetical protein